MLHLNQRSIIFYLQVLNCFKLTLLQVKLTLVIQHQIINPVEEVFFKNEISCEK